MKRSADIRRHARSYSRGFTLVEILVVVLIIGLGIAIVSFSIGGNQPLRLRNEARQFAGQLEMAANASTLGGEIWGVQIYRDTDRDSGQSHIGWRWLRFREPSLLDTAGISADDTDKDKKSTSEKPAGQHMGWQLGAPPELEASGVFSDDVDAVLEIEGKEVVIESLSERAGKGGDRNAAKQKESDRDSKAMQPDIWITPGGDMTPFALQLRFVGEHEGPVVRGDSIGRIELDTQHEAQ